MKIMLDSTTITILLEGTRDTLYMTLMSTFFGYVLGIAVVCSLSEPDVMHMERGIKGG